MEETWATSAGLDLHLELSGTRPRAGLESALREAVRSGRLPAGTALPSSRALAADLGLARNTVADAYGQLVAEGWFAARHGSGTWVAEQAALVPSAGRAQARDAPAGVRYDLRPGFPDVSAFPRAAWLASARRSLATAPARSLVGYADPRGLPVLRRALAEYIARARGVSASPDRIIVCAGFAQGLELLCDLLRTTGQRTLAIEAYGHPAQRQVAVSAGIRLAPVPVDDRGALAGGAPPPEGADAMLLTPAHQYPLGVALAPERRRLAVDWAAAGNGLIIEDDYDGEFRYDRQAVGALQSLAPDHVVYAGTASKSLVPGLRLGWLAVPERLAGELTTIKRETGRLSSSLDQLTLAEFISSGGYDRQVRRARLAYRARRDRLVSELRRQVPDASVTGIAAGLHVLVRLPADVAEEDVIARAAARGLALEGLASCRADEAGWVGGPELGPALIVGYATPPGHAFSACVARLCAALRDVLKGG
ncbi:MAG TPA: PLP-dependent aminotransferase family protein [Streptosporangiaceae bacterium]|nr:PLP-dependent aminotransferase family protein [Streptosporangiaceae bacterium]